MLYNDLTEQLLAKTIKTKSMLFTYPVNFLYGSIMVRLCLPLIPLCFTAVLLFLESHVCSQYVWAWQSGPPPSLNYAVHLKLIQ